MSAVHFILHNSFGEPLGMCEVTFHTATAPSVDGGTMILSLVCSETTDAHGEATVHLAPGDYIMRFPTLPGVFDKLCIRVGDAAAYELDEVLAGGNWISPMRDFLRKEANLTDVPDPAAAFAAIKQDATLEASGAVRLASAGEVATGEDEAKALTPASLAPTLAGKVNVIDFEAFAGGISASLDQKADILHGTRHGVGGTDPVALDASQIVSGMLDVARIPVLPSQTVQVSSGGIINLTAAQQSAIAKGTVVTTTDGLRWVYSGAGSKTAEASYIQLADITPDWSAVANKPSFGAASLLNVGIATGTVAAGDDSRFGNASALSTGTVPSARGGAGSVSGLLWANGSGAVSQGMYFLALANDLLAASTTIVASTESVTLPAGTYLFEAHVYATTQSSTGGVSATLNYSTNCTSGFFRSSGKNSATYNSDLSAVSMTREGWWSNSMLYAISCWSQTAASKTATAECFGQFTLAAPSVMKFGIQQLLATDTSNPAILRAGSYMMFTRVA